MVVAVGNYAGLAAVGSVVAGLHSRRLVVAAGNFAVVVVAVAADFDSHQ